MWLQISSISLIIFRYLAILVLKLQNFLDVAAGLSLFLFLKILYLAK